MQNTHTLLQKMIRIGVLNLAFGVLFLGLPSEHFAQDNRLVNTHSWQYEYIQRLQQRGYMLQLNPTDLPYAEKDITKALSEIDEESLDEKEQRWVHLLARRFEERPVNVDSMRVGGLFSGGARHSSSDRLNVINPSGSGEILLPRGKLNGYLEWKNWIGQAGITFDWFYDIDPDGLDTANRLYIRSEETYFGYNGNRIELYVGRFDNQWSTYGRRGAFLTDNPRSFDQIQLKFGSSKLSFSSILGELDNMSPDSTFTGRSFELGSYRRYLFMHRLDWSPTPNLKLSFMEGELYFSPTAGISIRNLIPLHFLFFESHNSPMNNNSNLMLGGSVWYQTGNWTFYVQGMLDDLVVEDRDELREENNLIPTTYTINSSIKVTDIANTFDLGLEADLVGANAYRSFRYQDQWTYAQRGLATNFSDYIRTKAYAIFYPNWLEGLTVEPAVTFYYKGTEDLRDLRTSTEADGSQIPGILAGTVERTIRPSLYLRYQPVGTNLFGSSNDVRFNFWIDADMGINFNDNYQNIEGAGNRRFIGLFRLFGQFTF
jgi:hypothetical protein